MPGSRASEAVRREQILLAAYQVAATEGLDATTFGRIAEAAGISAGLVVFHFKSKRRLMIDLLDWLLATTTTLRVDATIDAITAPQDRLLAVLRQEMDRLSSEPLRVRLTFDFWSAGIRDAEIRERMRQEFARYREAFRPLVASVLEQTPDRLHGVTADGLAAVSVSFIKGCAVQSMIDEDRFDIGQYLTAAEGMLAQFGVVSATVSASASRAAGGASLPGKGAAGHA